MCIDYRTLNACTIPNQYTVPRNDDVLDCITGSRWFSGLEWLLPNPDGRERQGENSLHMLIRVLLV